MSTSTKKKTQEQSTTQENANENGNSNNSTFTINDEINKNNKQLITHEKIENTPFIISGNEDNGYVLRLGDYRLTEIMETPQHIQEYVNIQTWNLITNLIITMIELDKKQTK